MSDIFISHSTADENLARFLHRHLTDEGLKVFLASSSLTPGQKWAPEVLSALSASSVVLFLASKAACTSPWVQQELGAALISKKKIIPIVWDLTPEDLPGWTTQFQALNFSNSSAEEVKAAMAAIAKEIKINNATGLVIAGLVFGALIVFGGKG